MILSTRMKFRPIASPASTSSYVGGLGYTHLVHQNAIANSQCCTNASGAKEPERSGSGSIAEGRINHLINRHDRLAQRHVLFNPGPRAGAEFRVVLSPVNAGFDGRS